MYGLEAWAAGREKNVWRSNMKRVTRLSWMLVGAVLGWTLSGCGGGQEAKKDSPSPVVAASVARVEASDVAVAFEAVGTLRARTSTVVSSKMVGTVTEMKVRLGDRVEAGQTIAVLDARDAEAGVNQAQAAVDEARGAVREVESAIASARAQVDLAQTTFDRMKGLYDKQSVSRQEFDEASARLSVAKAGCEAAASKMSQIESKIKQAEAARSAASVVRGYSVIVAPSSGIISEKQGEVGVLAAPGSPLVTIESGRGLRMEAMVDESRLGLVSPGTPVTVKVGAVDRSFEAKVTEIVPAVDSTARTVVVRIDLPPDPAMRPGLFGRATFAAGSRRALTVPAAAVAERGQLQSVFVVEGGVARARMITAGVLPGDRKEVLTGLAEGESVVCPVPANMVDGARVEVRK